MSFETELNIALTAFFRPIVAQCVQEAIEKIQVPPAAPVLSDEVLTIEKAAEFLSLKKQTVYSLVSENKIPYSKPTGSRLYFSRLALIDWLNSNRKSTISEQVAQHQQTRPARRTRKTGTAA